MENSPSDTQEISQEENNKNEKEKVNENIENNSKDKESYTEKELDLKSITVCDGVSYDKDNKNSNNEQAKTFSKDKNF